MRLYVNIWACWYRKKLAHQNLNLFCAALSHILLLVCIRTTWQTYTPIYAYLCAFICMSVHNDCRFFFIRCTLRLRSDSWLQTFCRYNSLFFPTVHNFFPFCSVYMYFGFFFYFLVYVCVCMYGFFSNFFALTTTSDFTAAAAATATAIISNVISCRSLAGWLAGSMAYWLPGR